MNLCELSSKIISGYRLTRNDDLSFFKDCNLDELTACADKIRDHFKGNNVDLCTIRQSKQHRKKASVSAQAKSSAWEKLLKTGWTWQSHFPSLISAQFQSTPSWQFRALHSRKTRLLPKKKSYALSQCSASSIPRQTFVWPLDESSLVKTEKGPLNRDAALQSQETCSPQVAAPSRATKKCFLKWAEASKP